MPTVCPICGGPVTKPAGEAVARCANLGCFAIQWQQLGHFASKEAYDIDGLGAKIIEQLLMEGIVEDAADFFALTGGDLQPLERFAEKSAKNLIQAISDRKKVSL